MFDVILFYSPVVFWFSCGIYSFPMNFERCERMYGRYGLNSFPGTLFQSLMGVLIGPIGLLFTLKCGGRWDWWRR